MFGILRIVRAIAGLGFFFQLIGLFPALTWLQDTSAVDSKMVAFMGIKILLALVFGAIFFGMRLLINWLHIKKDGEPHPALANKSFAL